MPRQFTLIDLMDSDIQTLSNWASVARTLNEARRILNDGASCDLERESCIEDLRDLVGPLDRLHNEFRQSLWVIDRKNKLNAQLIPIDSIYCWNESHVSRGDLRKARNILESLDYYPVELKGRKDGSFRVAPNRYQDDALVMAADDLGIKEIRCVISGPDENEEESGYAAIPKKDSWYWDPLAGKSRRLA